MNGTRLPDGFDCTSPTPPGAYWIDERGEWAICTPNGRIGSVAKHTVVEHEDRTITVSPSILVYAVEPRIYAVEERARMVALVGEADVQSFERGKPEYHGFLERGVWRSC